MYWTVMFVDDYQISQFIYKGYSVCVWITDFVYDFSFGEEVGSIRMGSSHGTTTWSQPPSLTSPNDARSPASNQVRSETCERPGQVNNLAPLKTDIFSPFSAQRQGWRTIKPSPGARSKLRCLSLLRNEFNSYVTL
jgi:hypothetical protein